MPLPDYPVLIYRGHFEVTVGFDHSGSILSAGFGGGFQETEVIFPKLRTAALNYSNLHRHALIEVAVDTFVNRLDYIVNFYNTSKENGNEPFLMQTPLDGAWFLWVFEEDNLDVRLIDLYTAASGLKLRQVYVRGLAPDNPDGSFEEEGS